jgi:prenyltransferase beta subunit
MKPLFVLFAFASLAVAQEPPHPTRKASVEFLLSLKQPDGSYLPDPTAKQSSLRATSAAVRAIKYLGGEVPQPEVTLKFFRSCYDPRIGTYLDRPATDKADSPSPVMAAVGIMAVRELSASDDVSSSLKYLVANAKSFEERRLAVAGMEAAKHFDPTIDEWFTEIDKTRNADGTFGSGPTQPRDTAGVVAMKLRAGRKLGEAERAASVRVLCDGQAADGGYLNAKQTSSDLESTYRVMRALHLLGEKPKNVAKLNDFLASCGTRTGGYGTTPKQPPSASGTYYAAIIQHWLK